METAKCVIRLFKSRLNSQVACLLMVFLIAPVAQASPGVVNGSYPDAPTAQQSQQKGESDQSTSSSAVDQPQDHKPVGTAAAPYERATGIPGSRPAGAVIAPGKQRRARAIFIRVGIVVAAAAAAGTVVALSQSSPSRP